MLLLAERYRLGETGLRGLLVEANIALALSIASIYARKDPRRADEYGGDAMLELVKAVDQYPSKAKDNNIRAFIHYKIWWRLKRTAYDDQLIRVPYRTAMWQLSRGTFERFAGVQDLSPLLDLDSTAIKALMTEDTTLTVDTNDIKVIELDIDEDREIIELKLIGCGDAEIARAMNLEVRYVFRRRSEIMSRLNLIYRRLENGSTLRRYRQAS